jgi:alpha-mannosidase
VLVTAIKPSDDGQAWIVRLFGAAGNDVQASIKWSDPQPETMWLSDLSEKPLHKLADKGSATVEVAAWDIVTIRAERPNARMAKFGVAD